MNISDVTGIIAACATLGTLLYISRQVTVTRQQTKGQFLLALDEQFEKTNPIMISFLNEPTWTPVDAEWYPIYQMMSVFERINIMVDDKILDIGIVDRLYGFRLLHIIANDAIYQRLVASGIEWQDFIDLCYVIADYRERHPNAVKQNAAFIDRVRKLNKEARSAKSPWGFS